MNNIDLILQKYKTPDKWLGTRETASFEAEVVKELEKDNNYTFADFKKIYTFLSSNDCDDSATGLEYLYAALNKLMATTLADSLGIKSRNWKWVKGHLENDFFLETLLSIYTDEKYQDEVMGILDKIVADREAEIEREAKMYNVSDRDDVYDDDYDDDYDDCRDACYDEVASGIELYRHSAYYYKAVYLRNIGSQDYESYLDEHITQDDIKLLKKTVLVARGEVETAFELIKDDFVLEAAELLDGKRKEEYLFSKILNGREHFVGQKLQWWDKLCKVSDSVDDYISELSTSRKHCELVNWQLYTLKRYEELKNRIDTGWIYDDPWGRIKDGIVAQYNAVKSYKKLKDVFPEWYAGIMIEYSVLMIEEHTKRKSYHISAQTMARAGKINEKCMEMAKKAAAEMVELYPKRLAMIEELRMARLV